ncbi:Exodeoxyribonuclease 7 large subunit [Candidatus Desulfarcum epimagneticum]|uniref:Exodeoxyribonuclease 7 large subunit n=1 Tax=uncultured Desulfobacteraceae bacterium TaxID=218296 RepID=A0A484HJ02_9BACT|nr:Exodeoxyribonuclease 7 large subunit [uncultured Desulfobacteraceae bacterium]
MSSATSTPAGILTVSQLTSGIKGILEREFDVVWVTGEISNFARPPSGHFYFTLKDSAARIGAVMFKGRGRGLKFMPEDGMSVVGMGRVSVYEPRGVYQIIFEYLEPEGFGALQKAFEQLKEKLFKEGLFDEARKKNLPFLPRKVSVITSPSGAVVHDILKVAFRRFPNLHVEIVPVRVQGHGAAGDMVSAISMVNQRGDSDVIIIARGGGSLEDLFPFNSEELARAIHASDIPVASAVGHETDFTIADMAADLRAPTPSAAAEMIVPVKDHLKQALDQSYFDLKSVMLDRLDRDARRLGELGKRLSSPEKKVQDRRLRTDETTRRLIRGARLSIHGKKERFLFLKKILYAKNPLGYVEKLRLEIERLTAGLSHAFETIQARKKSGFGEMSARLGALDPLGILRRGYSIARTVPDGEIIKDPSRTAPGRDIEVIVEKGVLVSRVLKTSKSERID